MTRARPRVLITPRLPRRALDRVAAVCDLIMYDGEAAMPRDRLLAQTAGKAGTINLLTDRIDEEFLSAAGPQLIITVNYAVRFDNIDLNACTSRAVLATNAPDILADTAADMAFALMMGAASHADEDDHQHARDVHHQTLGIVGFGRIGQALARLARGSGMNVVYHGTHRVAEVGQRLGAQYRDLEDLLREADFVSLHTDLSAGSGRLINAEQLAMMKPTAVLVNTSGERIVDEQALGRALRGGRLRAAGIDIVGPEPQIHPDLLACQNALVVRHLGVTRVPARQAMAHLAVDNLLAGLQGERPPSLLNPQAWLQRRAQARRPRLAAGSAQENARRSGSEAPAATAR